MKTVDAMAFYNISFKKIMMKNIIYYLLIFIWTGLIFLSDCKPPDAKAYTLKFNLQDTVPGQEVPGDGIWQHPVADTANVWVSWGLDSMLTTYGSLPDIEIKLPSGDYQFHIYPDRWPEFSKSAYWEYWEVWHLDEAHQIMPIYPETNQYLILLDTVSTWGFLSFEGRKQGFYYTYVDVKKHPSFWFDYYCGKKGVDSTLMEVQIDSAKAGKIYLVKCNEIWALKLRPDIRWTWTMADAIIQSRE